jgi:hypothetical protein
MKAPMNVAVKSNIAILNILGARNSVTVGMTIYNTDKKVLSPLYRKMSDSCSKVGGGKRQVVFIRNGEKHKRTVHVDKQGKSYVVYKDKKVPVNKLKIISDVYQHTEAFWGFTTYDNKNHQMRQMYKRKVIV